MKVDASEVRRSERLAWEPMRITDVGDLRQVVQTSTGGGKSIPSPGDPGESNKNRNHG